MFNHKKHAAIVISEQGVTALLLNKNKLKWQLKKSWRFCCVVDTQSTTISKEIFNALQLIGKELHSFRCKIAVVVTYLPFFQYKLPLPHPHLSLTTLQQLAENMVIQKSGLDKAQLVIDFRLQRKSKNLFILACNKSDIIRWQSCFMKCRIIPNVFENIFTLQQQYQATYSCYQTPLANLTWSNFHISTHNNEIPFEYPTLLAIILTVRPNDTLCC